MNREKRIYLLPGFGEDERIFRNLIPHLSGYNTFIVNYEYILSYFTISNITLDKFTRHLVQYYEIQEQDILIGHSMGGYIAHHIRQQVKCSVCMHSSFTHPNKIKFLINNEILVRWSISKGLFDSKALKVLSKWRYKNKPSAQEVEHVLGLLNDYGSSNILKLILLFFKRKRRFMNWLRSTPEYDHPPCLVLHPENDRIVSHPDEHHTLVPGDHFSIVTHATITADVIKEWLDREHSQRTLVEMPIISELVNFKQAI